MNGLVYCWSTFSLGPTWQLDRQTAGVTQRGGRQQTQFVEVFPEALIHGIARMHDPHLVQGVQVPLIEEIAVLQQGDGPRAL